MTAKHAKTPPTMICQKPCKKRDCLHRIAHHKNDHCSTPCPDRGETCKDLKKAKK